MGQRGTMKKLIIIILSQLMCFQAFAWRESNGGNGVTAEAMKIANTLLDEIWQVPVLRTYYVASDFLIIPERNLKLDGKPVDAYTHTNTAADNTLVFIDIDKWNARTKEQKRLLILHELTHFMSLIDHGYKISYSTLDKIDRFKKLEAKYPNAEYPIDQEIITTLKLCNLTNFVLAYLLIGDLNHVVEEKNKSISQLVEQSKCSNIQNYAPLKKAMLEAKAVN